MSKVQLFYFPTSLGCDYEIVPLGGKCFDEELTHRTVIDQKHVNTFLALEQEATFYSERANASEENEIELKRIKKERDKLFLP